MSNELMRLSTWFVPAASVAGGVTVGIIVRQTLLALLAKAAQRSAWKYDDAIVAAIRSQVVVWFGLIGLRLGLRILPLESEAESLLGALVLGAAILSVTWAVAVFAGLALQARASEGTKAGVTLIANVVRAVIYILGVLVVLQTFGISITPIITALGVGGLAVGLALQDTLANFFAGLRILAAGNIRPGDFIRLDSGEEGFVEDITWAQTTIRQLPNSLVVVPNAKIASAISVNYSLPEQEQSVVVQVGVSYSSDLDHVERVTLEVARSVLREHPSAVTTFEPGLRFHTFGDSSINMNVVLRAKHYTERFLLVNEFVKRLHRRYREEGIEIPFPQRDVHVKSGKMEG